MWSGLGRPISSIEWRAYKVLNLRIMFISRRVLGCSTRVNHVTSVAHTCTRADRESFVGLGGGGGSSFYNMF